MLTIKTVDAEIVKDGVSHLVSKNDLTGASLEVLSFIPSKIKKRSGSDHSDGRPGRINYHSEDEYRTIRMTVESTAEDMHDIAHLRDAIYDLFDGEFYIREKRIMNVDVEYESPGQKTGELQLPEPQYVNGKQIYVSHVGDIEISDEDLQSTFVVEMETVELPYYESIYTTLELHDTGYSSTAEKYGLVDNINVEKVKYRFEPENQWNPNLIPLNADRWEDGSLWSSGAPTASSNGIRMKDSLLINVQPGREYTIYDESLASSNVALWRVFEVEPDNTLFQRTFIDRNSGSKTFVANSEKILLAADHSGNSNIEKTFLNDGKIKVKFEEGDSFTGFSPKTEYFTVYNAGNVTIEPESMYLAISVKDMQSLSGFKITNKSTGEVHEHTHLMGVARDYEVRGLNTTRGGSNAFRYTNRRFISLKPGDNLIEVSGGIFSEINFEFKYLYK